MDPALEMGGLGRVERGASLRAVAFLGRLKGRAVVLLRAVDKTDRSDALCMLHCGWTIAGERG